MKKALFTTIALTAVLSDMPKGSKLVYDNETESLTILLDKITNMRNSIQKESEKMETKLQEQLEQLQPRHGLLLYHYYILGDSMDYIAKKVIHYGKKYAYDLKKEALDEFDRVQEKKG